MAERKNQEQSKDFADWKPGSESKDAKNVGGEGDFGVPVGAGPSLDRDYVNENTKRADPGAAQQMDWDPDGKRDHGVGAADSGPGSGSAGDIDPDIIGVGTGGSGITASGVTGRPLGPDDSDGTSAEFASGAPAQGRNQTHVGQVGGSKRVQGDVQTRGQDASTNEGEGGDAITNPQARGDDAFAGEVSSGEARGEDNEAANDTDG